MPLMFRFRIDEFIFPLFLNLVGKKLPLPSRLRSVAGCTEAIVDVLFLIPRSTQGDENLSHEDHTDG